MLGVELGGNVFVSTSNGNDKIYAAGGLNVLTKVGSGNATMIAE